MKKLVLATVAVLLLVGAFGAGFVAHRNELVPSAWRTAAKRLVSNKFLDRLGTERGAPADRGDVVPMRRDGGGARLDEKDTDALLALGYVQGEESNTGGASGVVRHDRARAVQGLNLYVTGNTPDAVLMDMDGRELHRWHCDFETAFPNKKLPGHIREAVRHYFRRAHLYPSGDLLAIFEGVGLIKLDWDSNVLWVYQGGAHHDLFVEDSGGIYVLTNELRRFPRLEPDEDIVDNSIAVLSAEGEELRRVSILDSIANSEYAPLLDRAPKYIDVLHANTIERLDGAWASYGPAFRDGNVLVSIRSMDTIAIVDMETATVVWAFSGLWKSQHQPTLLENGNMLIFNNHAGPQLSRVLEFHPLSQAIVWAYPGPNDPAMYSDKSGAAERLANGDTLISVSGEGRAIEVAPDRQIVWEFINPNQYIEGGVSMIGSLFELVRLPLDYCAGRLGTLSR